MGTNHSLPKYSTSLLGKENNEGLLLSSNKCMTELSLHNQSIREPSEKQGLLENKKLSGFNNGINDTTPKSEVKVPMPNKKIRIKFADI